MLIKTTERAGFMGGNDSVNLKQVLSLNLYKILEEMEKKIFTSFWKEEN